MDQTDPFLKSILCAKFDKKVFYYLEVAQSRQNFLKREYGASEVNSRSSQVSQRKLILTTKLSKQNYL